MSEKVKKLEEKEMKKTLEDYFNEGLKPKDILKQKINEELGIKATSTIYKKYKEWLKEKGAGEHEVEIEKPKKEAKPLKKKKIKIKEADLSLFFKLMNPLLERLGADPISDGEAHLLANTWAPYMKFTEEVGIGFAVLITLMVMVPRVLQIVMNLRSEKQQKKEEGERSEGKD